MKKCEHQIFRIHIHKYSEGEIRKLKQMTSQLRLYSLLMSIKSNMLKLRILWTLFKYLSNAKLNETFNHLLV